MLLGSVAAGSKATSLLVVRELRGQLYLMAAQYLYVKDRSRSLQSEASLQVNQYYQIKLRGVGWFLSPYLHSNTMLKIVT